MKIAILGATGHIARSLIDGFCREGRHELLLYARSIERTEQFVASTPHENQVSCIPIAEFGRAACDAVINCVGIGDPAKLKGAGASIFRLTETFDNMAIDHVAAHPGTAYIHFSSGAAYGTDFREPAGEATVARHDINAIRPGDYYGIAKLHAEAKHRALTDLWIVDLRIFGFFSRFIDPETGFFLAEVLSSIRRGRILLTGPEDVIRDYVDPRDLLSLVLACIAGKRINDVFDVYSRKAAMKSEILAYFSSRHGLRYRIDEATEVRSVTGAKPMYYSENRKAARIGYAPAFTSLEAVARESDMILGIPGAAQDLPK